MNTTTDTSSFEVAFRTSELLEKPGPEPAPRPRHTVVDNSTDYLAILVSGYNTLPHSAWSLVSFLLDSRTSRWCAGSDADRSETAELYEPASLASCPTFTIGIEVPLGDSRWPDSGELVTMKPGPVVQGASLVTVDSRPAFDDSLPFLQWCICQTPNLSRRIRCRGCNGSPGLLPCEFLTSTMLEQLRQRQDDDDASRGFYLIR